MPVQLMMGMILELLLVLLLQLVLLQGQLSKLTLDKALEQAIKLALLDPKPTGYSPN